MGIAEIVAIVGIVGNLVPLVEKLFGAFQGAGVVKKDVVTQSVTAALSGLATISTGGQKDTITALQPAIGTLIDSTVAIMNGMSRIIGTGEIIDTTGATVDGAAKTASLG